jgi:hypothetical protein
MTPHLFFGLCRALWMTPLTLAAIAAATMMAGRSGLLPEDPATRGQRPEPEKRPEPRPRPRLRLVGEDG